MSQLQKIPYTIAVGLETQFAVLTIRFLQEVITVVEYSWVNRRSMTSCKVEPFNRIDEKMPNLSLNHNTTRKYVTYGGGALFLLSLLAWTVMWFYLSARTEEVADELLGELNNNGIQLSCAERSVSGFPFSIKINCFSPELKNIEPISNIKAGKLIASVSIFFPGTYTFAVESPVHIQSDSFSAEEAVFEWDLAQLKIGTDNGSIEELTVNFESVTGKSALDDPSPEVEFDQFALNLLSQSINNDAGVNLKLNAEGLGLNNLGYSIDQADVDFLFSMPMSESLSSSGIFELVNHFMRIGGKFHVRKFGLNTMGVATEIGGDFDLPPSGLLSGQANMWISGVDKLTSIIEKNFSDEFRSTAALLPSVLSVFPSSERDGRSGIELTINIDNGKVQVGFFSLGTIPPLF